MPVTSQAFLPPFSRPSHAFGKVLASPWSLLGLGKYLATPWVELGDTVPAPWENGFKTDGGKINFPIWHFLRTFANPYARACGGDFVVVWA